VSEDNQQEKNQEKKVPCESLEEFSKRVGLKYVKEKAGGEQFLGYPGGNLSHERPKQSGETLEQFSKRVGLKYVREHEGQEFSPYHGPRKAPSAPLPESDRST
jgi:hypothetical protein